MHSYSIMLAPPSYGLSLAENREETVPMNAKEEKAT